MRLNLADVDEAAEHLRIQQAMDAAAADKEGGGRRSPRGSWGSNTAADDSVSRGSSAGSVRRSMGLGSGGVVAPAPPETKGMSFDGGERAWTAQPSRLSKNSSFNRDRQPNVAVVEVHPSRQSSGSAFRPASREEAGGGREAKPAVPQQASISKNATGGDVSDYSSAAKPPVVTRQPKTDSMLVEAEWLEKANDEELYAALVLRQHEQRFSKDIRRSVENKRISRDDSREKQEEVHVDAVVELQSSSSTQSVARAGSAAMSPVSRASSGAEVVRQSSLFSPERHQQQEATVESDRRSLSSSEGEDGMPFSRPFVSAADAPQQPASAEDAAAAAEAPPQLLTFSGPVSEAFEGGDGGNGPPGSDNAARITPPSDADHPAGAESAAAAPSAIAGRGEGATGGASEMAPPAAAAAEEEEAAPVSRPYRRSDDYAAIGAMLLGGLAPKTLVNPNPNTAAPAAAAEEVSAVSVGGPTDFLESVAMGGRELGNTTTVTPRGPPMVAFADALHDSAHDSAASSVARSDRSPDRFPPQHSLMRSDTALQQQRQPPVVQADASTSVSGLRMEGLDSSLETSPERPEDTRAARTSASNNMRTSRSITDMAANAVGKENPYGTKGFSSPGSMMALPGTADDNSYEEDVDLEGSFHNGRVHRAPVHLRSKAYETNKEEEVTTVVQKTPAMTKSAMKGGESWGADDKLQWNEEGKGASHAEDLHRALVVLDSERDSSKVISVSSNKGPRSFARRVSMSMHDLVTERTARVKVSVSFQPRFV